MSRPLAALLIAAGLVTASPAPVAAAKPPPTWDNLVHTPSKKMGAVYLAPGADFRTYTKVMIDPPEVAFQKDWLRDYNNSALDLSRRMSEAEAAKLLDKARTGFEDIFAKAYRDAGYQVVTAPGADVLRLRTAVLDLEITAPDRMSPGRTYTFSADAGQATFVVEARDSLSGALMGRAIDKRIAGDDTNEFRSRVTNIGDFEVLFRRWAKRSAEGLTHLKELSPVAVAAR